MMIDGFELRPFDEGDEELIEKKLKEYNYSVVPPVEGAEEEEFVLKISDGDGNVIGGCLLEIDRWQIADLDILWVDEKHRRQGLGSMLIREAERISREKGCSLSALGTFDFQARPLYEKHGYTHCGTIENWPRGHENYTLAKRLDLPCPAYVPSHNEAQAKYEVSPGSKEDREAIINGLRSHNNAHVTELIDEVSLNKKLVDAEGNLIAACVAEVDDWGEACIDLWVEEPYRSRGIGSRLLLETEREAREKGAYVMLVWLLDWQAPFFEKHGYTVCTAIDDCPKGHRFYTMRKDF